MSGLAALAAIALFSARPAVANGGFFPTLNAVAVSADQRAIIVRKGDATSLILSTGYSGEGADFAWIIPTPVAPNVGDVREAGDPGEDAFAILDTITAVKVPRWWYHPGLRGGPEADGRVLPPVVVHGRVTLEHYQVSVLSARGASPLLAWLEQNGYPVHPAAHAVLEQYIRQGWCFVALRLRPDTPRSYVDDFLPPVVITYRSREFVFPLRISTVSTHDEVRITLFVVAESTVSASNRSMMPLRFAAPFTGGDPGEYVEAGIRGSLAEARTGLVRTWSGRYEDTLYAVVVADLRGEPATFPWPEETLEKITGIVFDGGRFLSRFEARLSPLAMTDDLIFTLDAHPTESGDRPGIGWPY